MSELSEADSHEGSASTLWATLVGALFAELNLCSVRVPLDLRRIARVWFKSLAQNSQKTLSHWSSKYGSHADVRSVGRAFIPQTSA